VTWGYFGVSGAGTDWLNVVCPAAAKDALRQLVERHLGFGQDIERGLHGYNRIHRWETGALLAWSDRLDHCLLSLNGDSVECFPLPLLFPFVQALAALGCRCSRIDLRYDDYTRKLIPLDLVHAAAESGDFLGFKVHAAIREKRRTGEITQDQHRFGATGKAGGGKMVVFYDKCLESDGERNCIRLEVRYFKEKAALVFDALAAAPDEDAFTAQIGAFLGGCIDFRDREGKHKHRARMERFDWWQRAVDVLQSAPVIVMKSKPPLQKTMEYHRSAFAVSLALTWEIVESQGEDADAFLSSYFRLMVDAGKQKLCDGYRPGARALGLDLPALLGAST
jgi:DNA relaxase NicK